MRSLEVETIGWENSSWKYVSLIGDERIINLQRTNVYVFSDSVLCLGKIHENPQSNDAWEDRLVWFKSSPEYRNFDRIDGEPMEFEWNIVPGFTTLQLSQKVHELLLRLGETPENFYKTNHLHVDVQRHLLWIKRNAQLVSQNAKRFGMGHWSFLGLGSEKKWYSTSADSPQGEWDKMVEKMMLEFAESGHPVFRATSPLSRGYVKRKRRGKLSIH